MIQGGWTSSCLHNNQNLLGKNTLVAEPSLWRSQQMHSMTLRTKLDFEWETDGELLPLPTRAEIAPASVEELSS
jgi:hypothetical protein